MTKTLTFKNEELAPLANFLGNLNLKSKASRGRTKLIKLLVAKNNEFNDERKEALDPFILKDDQGEGVEGNTPGSIKLIEEKQGEAAAVVQEINSESAVIEFTEYSEKMNALYDSIADYPDDFSNQDAIVYDLIMDQFEAAFESEKDGEK